MTGFQPLIIDAGQIERAGERRVEILRLNIGPAIPIFVSGSSFTITRSCHTISNLTNNDLDVMMIDGGEEGDVVVFLTGLLNKKVKLKQSANLVLTNEFQFQSGKPNSITLYNNGSSWEEIARAN
jgi:hypothetical protein